jgi:hypothetical protein
MSFKEIRSEIEYYTGKKPTAQEAQEIAMFYNNGYGASLDEIISDYYGCI